MMECLERIEAKLDALIDALADDGEDLPELTLDGEPVGAERTQRQEL